MKRPIRILTSLLLMAVLVIACLVPGFAAADAALTTKEQQTQRLIADVLDQNRTAVRLLQQEDVFTDFLDTVEQQRKAWVQSDAADTRAELRARGISPSATVADLRESDDAEAQKLYRELCDWLVKTKEDSSVLAYSQFSSVEAIEDLPLTQLIDWSSLQNYVDSIVPLLLQDALDLLRMAGIDLPIDLKWPLLDQKKIVDYAHRYAKNYNTDYRVPESGSDCTNFVSQALYAGGLDMRPASSKGLDAGIRMTTEEWYYYNLVDPTAKLAYGKAVAVSSSWIRVEDLYVYLAPHYPVVVTTDEEEVRENLKAGYVIQGGPLIGRYEHSSIVTEKNGKYCYTAHTNDRKDRDMKHYFNAYDRFRVIQVC